MMHEIDTFASPYEWQTVASHSTWGSGNAIIAAAESLKQQLCASAARYFDTQPEDIVLAGGYACFGDGRIGWGQLGVGLTNPDGSGMTKPLEGIGYFVPEGVQNPDPHGGQSNAAADWTVGCVGAEVGIDTQTGEIHVYRLINCLDAGTIINPKNASEQVKGAMVLALGSTISETLAFSADCGNIRNNSLTDYKIPGIEDMPDSMEVMFIETPELTGPFGAKGLGEHGAVASTPALLSAIEDAIGRRFTTLPVTADMMAAACKEVNR
jgi:carbon-monoxide dehydrogenase large subunit